MKLIEPKVEIIQQEPNLEGIYKQIEQAARTCYKSEDKIVNVVSIDYATLPEGISTEDIPSYKDNQQQCIEYLCNHNIKYQIISSAKEFVDKLIKNKHFAMLEHGTVYLKVPVETWQDCWHEWVFMFPNVLPWISIDCDGKYHYITTNLRHIIEGAVGMKTINTYLCEPTECHEKRITLKFTTSIGIVRELLRHRHFSFANESTRFCRYKNGLTFIKPYWFVLPAGEVFWHDGICYRLYYNKNNPDEYISIIPSVVGEEFVHKAHTFLHNIDNAETRYLALLLEGLTAQQAREVLPLCTKSELVMTGFESDWKDFFDKRLKGTTGKPHPDMIYLCELAQEELTKNGIVL